MELAHRVPATFHCHDRSRRRVASVHAGVFVLLAIGASGAAEVNQGYPSAIVPFKAGLLLAEVEQAFENWRTAFEQHAPERLSAGCARTGGLRGVDPPPLVPEPALATAPPGPPEYAPDP